MCKWLAGLRRALGCSGLALVRLFRWVFTAFRRADLALANCTSGLSRSFHGPDVSLQCSAQQCAPEQQALPDRARGLDLDVDAELARLSERSRVREVR